MRAARLRAALAQVAMNAEQTIITTAVVEDIPRELQALQFRVTPGEVNRG